MERIYNILTEILGDSKQGSFSNENEQYQFNCIACTNDNNGIPDNKYNLEVLLSHTKGLRFHCWKCGDINNTKGNLSLLIKKYGNRKLYDYFNEVVKDIYSSKLYDINFLSGLTDSINDNYNLRLPNTFKPIDICTCKNKKLLDYLCKRRIDQSLIDEYNIGYTEWDNEEFSFRNKIIIPSYNNFGELNYFIGRDYTGKSKLKYCNCDVDKKSIIFQESKIDWDSPIYLCEGVFDSMRLPFNGISMLGKSLSKDSYLFNEIYKNANSTITIILDGDTNIFEIKRIYNLLNFGRLTGNIYVIILSDCSKYKDLSEIYENEGRNGVINILKKQIKFDKLDLF